MALDLAFVREILPEMVAAAGLTVEISLITLAFVVPLSFAMAIASILGPRWLRLAINGYTGATRGVPPLVQIAIVYFLLPRAGVLIDEFWTGVIALTMIGTGYAVAIIRGGILSVDKGQRETALALGFTEAGALALVIVPQAMKRILPPIANEVANLVKASALLSVISVKELTKVSNDLIFEHFVVVEVMILLAAFYLVIVGALMAVSRWLERRAKG